MARARTTGLGLAATAAAATAVAAAALTGCGFGDDARQALASDAAARAADAPTAADALPPGPDAPPAADAGPDGPPGVPDLVWVAGEMTPTVRITEQYFGPGSCEVAEGCVGAAGMRRLLRFAAVTENQGTGDLDLGPPPPPGVSAGLFVWSACHMHHHIAGFADYALVDGGGTVTAGHKQGFCLEDDERERAGAPSHGYTCTDQGISPGWADVYEATIPCQWIDVTGVAPGFYTLRVSLNPEHVLPESDYDNDTLTIDVAL